MFERRSLELDIMLTHDKINNNLPPLNIYDKILVDNIISKYMGYEIVYRNEDDEIFVIKLNYGDLITSYFNVMIVLNNRKWEAAKAANFTQK